MKKKTRRYYKYKSRIEDGVWYVYDRKPNEIIAEFDYPRHAILFVRLLNKAEVV